jgi:general stress protein 26
VANQLSDEEKRERLREVVADFDVAMVCTHTSDGGLRSRPLAIADKRDDGTLYFSTAAESHKVDEIEADPRVNVTMQDGRRFVSLTGMARVVDDRALVDKLWSESWKIWFPKGKDDPSLRVLIVDPHEAAYWDGKGVHGLKYVFQMAKAYLSGTRPPTDGDESHVARVKL